MKAQDVITAIKNTLQNRKQTDSICHVKTTNPLGGAQEKGKGNTTPKLKGNGKGKSKSKVNDQVPTKRDTRKGSQGEARGGNAQGEIKRKIPSLDIKVIKLFAELLEGATTQDLLSLLKFENTKRRILHVRQLHSERESHLGQHDSTACSVDFRLGSILVISGVAEPYQTYQKFTASLHSLANRFRWKLCYCTTER